MWMKNVAYCGMEHGTLGSAVMWNVTLGSMVVKYVDLEDLLHYGGTWNTAWANVKRKRFLCLMECQVLVWNGP